MRRYAFILGALVTISAFGARAADLVVWWDQGYYAEEDAALREIIAAFEQETGRRVELVFRPQEELPGDLVAVLKRGRPPDFAFGNDASGYVTQWAFDDRLVDLSEVIGSFANIFDPEVLKSVALVNSRTGQKALYSLPIGLGSNHIHVWKSLLKSAGLEISDIPRTWAAFWSFWRDEVQPAIRRATGREDIWAVGLSMSTRGFDSVDEFFQFVAAYEADYVTPDGRLVIDDPNIRQKLVEVVDAYTAIYRKGCTPPESVNWTPVDNNKAFLAQTVVMTPNVTLSIPNALKTERPEDYYQNTGTVEWPLGPSGKQFAIVGFVASAVVFKDASNIANAKEFVRFLVHEGWLAHYLNFSAERYLPPLPALLDAPFWLDPGDPHRMAGAIQVASRALMHDYVVASGDWRHDQIRHQENVWAKAIHRVAAEGISPEQAVDDAIARIKQILSE